MIRSNRPALHHQRIRRLHAECDHAGRLRRAPATFDTPTPAANHTVGDLSIGANVTVENATVANSLTGPLASAGANTDSDDFVWPNMTTNYSIVVSNAGPSAANGLVLHDPAPAGLTCMAATCGSPTGGAVCPAVTVAALQSAAGVTIAPLPANSSLTFTLTCTVN